MSGLVECNRCRKIMIDEEYQVHLCEPIMKNCKILKFTSYCIAKNSDGKTLLDITTLDGDSYIFEEVPENKEHTKIPYQPPNLNTKKFYGETPTGEQNQNSRSGKMSGFDL